MDVNGCKEKPLHGGETVGLDHHETSDILRIVAGACNAPESKVIQ